MTLGQNIQTARRAAGLSQEALAERIGVSRQALGKWEKDTALPGLENLRQLSAALGVSADTLLGRELPAAPGTPSEGTSAPLPADPPMTLESMKALLDARDAAEAKRRRLWALAGAVLAALAVLLGTLTIRRYNAALEGISANMGSLQSQMGLLGGQMSGYQQQLADTIAQASGNVAVWEYQVADFQKDGQLLSLAVSAAPRELPSGAGACFLLDTADGTLTAEGAAQDGGFAARFELPLDRLGGQPPTLRVQWLLPDGTVQNDLAGSLGDLTASFWPPRLEVLPCIGNMTIAYRLEAGGLTLNCYPISFDAYLPDWMLAQSAEVRLVVDGETADRAALGFYEAYWAGDTPMAWQEVSPLNLQGSYTATLDSDHAPYPYKGGQVYLQASVTDQFGNEWLSEPLYLQQTDH